MRIIELTENTKTILAASEKNNEEAAKKLASFIKENCQEWFAQSRDGFIYRGMTPPPESPLAFIKDVRLDRKPLDSSPGTHNLFNQLIKAAGKTANRSNSAFVSGNAGITEAHYGKPYVVFPIGAFNYTWHEKYEDWQVESKDLLNAHFRLANDDDESVVPKQGMLKHIKGDDGTLPQAIASQNEIMIHCKHYVAVALTYFSWNIKPLL